ncbi:MAG: TRAP transporter substrate-binding protein DctP [Chloroflexota bacterium]
MKVARFAIPLVVALALVMTLIPACAQPAAQTKIHWDVSLFGPPRALTYPIRDWAETMGKETNGLWEIQLHYGEVLAPSKDQLDGLKSGLFQVALWAPMYNPGKTPLHTSLEMAFFAPGTIPQIGQWIWEIGKQPAMVKELDTWNAQLLFPSPLPQYQFMGKKAIRTTDDLKGMRIRAAAEMGKPLEKYGAVLVMVPAPETYSALEKGMVDSILFVWTYTFVSYKLYELSKYATIDVDAGTTGMQVAVNKTAWNALPKEWQEKSTKWVEANIVNLYDKYNGDDDAKNLPLFKQAGIEIIKFPPAEKAKLLQHADTLWNEWAAKMDSQGLPGKQILEFGKATRAKVEGKK